MTQLSNLPYSLVEYLDGIIYASFKKSRHRFNVESVDSKHTPVNSVYVIQFNNKYYELSYDYDDYSNTLTLTYVKQVEPHIITKTEWR